jgi:hypothetical protein
MLRCHQACSSLSIHGAPLTPAPVSCHLLSFLCFWQCLTLFLSVAENMNIVFFEKRKYEYSYEECELIIWIWFSCWSIALLYYFRYENWTVSGFCCVLVTFLSFLGIKCIVSKSIMITMPSLVSGMCHFGGVCLILFGAIFQLPVQCHSNFGFKESSSLALGFYYV